MTFSHSVALSFRETMSGVIQDGAANPDHLNPRASNQLHNFKFTLYAETGSLQEFLSGPAFRAKVVGGAVIWSGKVPDGTPVAAGGSIVMYRDVTPDGRHKKFDFLFSFKDPAGTWFSVAGDKRLSDDRGSDAAADLSTLYVTIFANGKQVGAGVTTVHVDQLLDQVVSIEARGATGAQDAAAAKTAFIAFMNRQIHQVYTRVPVFFPAD